MTPAPKTRREQADQAFVRSLGDISSPDQDDLDLIACERIKWHEAVQWADSTPAPSEQEDEEYFKRINYFVWNYCDRDQRLTAESAFAQVLCDALNNARRAQNAEVERLREKVEQLKFNNDRFMQSNQRLGLEVNELLSFLERAMRYIKEGKQKFAPNTTNSLVDELLQDYERMKGDK